MSRSSQRSTIKDMTNGSPAKLILGFAVPMLMGLLFQQFYSMVDTIIVGKFLGVDALASVGSTSAINFMINGFVIGVCIQTRIWRVIRQTITVMTTAKQEAIHPALATKRRMSL